MTSPAPRGETSFLVQMFIAVAGVLIGLVGGLFIAGALGWIGPIVC